MKVEELANFPLSLPIQRIKSRLKIPRDESNAQYEHIMEKSFVLVEPIARFTHISCSVSPGKVQLSNKFVIMSGSLAKHLNSCTKVTMVGLTIGPFIEEEIEKSQKKNKILEPIIMDAVGSECAEEAAMYLSTFLALEISRSGCEPTKRYSPGYGDLNLTVQSYFHTLLNLAQIGITLTESFLMIPQKSITAFIGWRQ